MYVLASTLWRRAAPAFDSSARRPAFLSLSRLILPVAFFGYGIWANLSILSSGFDGPRPEGSVMRGEITERLSMDYARAVPHREAAVAWLGAARYLLLGEGRAGVVVGEDGWLFTEEEMVAATDAQIARSVEEAVAAQARLMAVGARLIVVPLPAKLDIYRDRAPRAAAARAMEEQQRSFIMALEAAGVDAVDARPALEQVARQGQAFLARDTHWTPDGTAAVAEAVARSGLVPAGQEEFLRRQEQPEEVAGDLVAFVTSPALAHRLGLSSEMVTPFRAQPAGRAEAGIFPADAPAITTVLVGTSYSADERWSFAPALALALSRDVLNLAQEGQGPIRPLRSLLDDPTLAATSLDYVIWEFPIRYIGDPAIWPEGPHTDPGAVLQRSLR